MQAYGQSAYDARYCTMTALQDCTVGTWYYNYWPYNSDPSATVTMVDCDCDPILQTLYFEVDGYDLDGLWHYDFDSRSYRLNSTMNANNITLHWPNEGMWIIEDDTKSDTIMRCTSVDLKDCSGRWYQYDVALGWYPSTGSMRLVTDCTLKSAKDSECDGAGITINDTDCMPLFTLCL